MTEDPEPDEDLRPEVSVGHVSIPVSDVERSEAFWRGLGMRAVVVDDHLAVLELRGGTHLVLRPGDRPPAGTAAPFDVMVDDIDAAHDRYSGAGLGPGEIERGRIHDQFTVLDPDGYVVTVTSSHVVGPV